MSPIVDTFGRLGRMSVAAQPHDRRRPRRRGVGPWFAELFGVAAPEQFGHFWQVVTANGVGLDFASVGDGEIAAQHYAFLVSEDEFDAIYGGVVELGLDHWADPMQRRPGEINHHDGGRGVYFPEPRRPLPRDHHPPVRQRRLTTLPIRVFAADRVPAAGPVGT